MTRCDFERLPSHKWDADAGRFSGFVLIPVTPRFEWRRWFTWLRRFSDWRAKHLHDSGYRRMIVAGVRGGDAVCLLTECSDVIHFDGIGGFGPRSARRAGWILPTARPICAWTIDCLPTSGFMHVFLHDDDKEIEVGSAMSSFEVYAVPKEKT